MMEPGNGTKNTAESGSAVGIQAEQVHNSTVYQVLPDAPPERKYDVGFKYLEHGVPTRARELIGDAIAHGHDNSRVRFHWVLAMLSKRAYRDLSADERDQLGRLPDVVSTYRDDEWKRALEAICELLDRLHGAGGDPGPALKQIRALNGLQREQVVRHLDLVLTGGLKDTLWADTRQAAEDARFAGHRTDRVWIYFQPVPAAARARPPARVSTTRLQWTGAVVLSAPCVAVAGYFGWVALTRGSMLSITAYLVALAAGYVGVRNAFHWHYRAERRRTKDREYSSRYGADITLEDGFAKKINHAFGYYFAKYAPKKMDREVWMTAISGFRKALRDEIVEIYRESRVEADQVHWLIRYLVSDVRRRWEKGTLREYATRFRVPPAVKLWCVLSFAILALAVTEVVVVASEVSQIAVVVAAVIGFLFGHATTTRWVHIATERRRFVEDQQEYERVLADREAAYRRWSAKLEGKPNESEMEAWLSADKTRFLDEVLTHYRLAWRDIIAHGLLQTPARNYKRARVPGGPWRYSKYDLRLFLITQEGVREVGAELDFEHSVWTHDRRNNFRFDAVSSVHVKKKAMSYTLELTLMGGPATEIRVVDPMVERSGVYEDQDQLSEINLDAAGFRSTLHILEGIAAEGKGWIKRDPRGPGDPSEKIDEL